MMYLKDEQLDAYRRGYTEGQEDTMRVLKEQIKDRVSDLDHPMIKIINGLLQDLYTAISNILGAG